VDGAVGDGHLQLGEQREPVAVEGAPSPEAQPAAEPAVAEQDLEAVLSGRDEVGDVVGLVAQPVLVRGPSRRQLLIADPPAVELGGVDAVCGGVQPGAHDAVRQHHTAGQDRRRRADAADLPGADEAGGPVARREQSGFDGGGLAPRAPAVAAPDPDPDGGALAAGERRDRPRHENLLGRLDPDRFGAAARYLQLICGLGEVEVGGRHGP
jgi:hypothetical protein